LIPGFHINVEGTSRALEVRDVGVVFACIFADDRNECISHDLGRHRVAEPRPDSQLPPTVRDLGPIAIKPFLLGVCPDDAAREFAMAQSFNGIAISLEGPAHRARCPLWLLVFQYGQEM
jgi:hypothetical protein